MALGSTMLGRRHVLPAVCSTLREIQVEGTFPMGTYLVTVHNPIATDDGDLRRALYGSFLPIPDNEAFPLPPDSEYELHRQPGAVVAVKGRVVMNENRPRIRLRVTSRGDRPIQVGSHYHFIEVNPQLEFDRGKAYGYRLDIAAGTSVRFEPGDTKTVTLVEIGGGKVIRGGNNLASGPVERHRVEDIVTSLQEAGFAHRPDPFVDPVHINMFQMDRAAYATMFGPTTGDLIRLGSTDLWIKVEKDLTSYGDECKFGGGKTLREGMGQATGRSDAETLDMVVTNALIVDWTGIYKADIGVKDGMIVGIGKAGSPDVMEGVTPNMIVGSCTDVVAGEGKIITAGGIDTHVHYICPQQALESDSTLSDSSKVIMSRPSFRNAGESRMRGTHSRSQASALTRPPGSPSTQGASWPSWQRFGVMIARFGVLSTAARAAGRASRSSTLRAQSGEPVMPAK